MPSWCTLECTSDLKSDFHRFDSCFGHMKTHRIIVKEEDWPKSKYRNRSWEERVDIIRWEHDYEEDNYKIDIKIK